MSGKFKHMNIRKLYNKVNIVNNCSKVSPPPPEKDEIAIINAKKNKLGWGKNKLKK